MKLLFWLALTLSFQASAYEICTEQNNYLESLLPNAGPEPYSQLPSACVERAQLNLAAAGYYGFCPSPEGMPGRTHPRPCISEKYVRAVHTALLDASECLGYDPRWAFASFNLESALHLNAVGAAGDVGVGQLTRSAIDQINSRARAANEEMMRKSGIPACKRLLGYIKPHSGEPDQRCGFMSLPENPRRNLIYSILLLRDNRKLVERYFQRLDIRLPQTVDVERLQHQLAKLAYNSGAAGLVAALKAYLDQMGTSAGPHHFHFENMEATSYPSYLGRHFPVKEGRESTRKRIAKYMKYVIASVRKVDGQLGGGVCLSPDMFPPLGVHPVDQHSPPDAKQARRLVTKYLLKLADKSEAFRKTSCKEARAQFRFEFVPAGLEPEDLPAPLYKRWLRLCGG
jgi:hypothetical protein